MGKIKKILIANRGEIALRIIRACHELDIQTVAVYSTADKYSLHVRFADEAVCIGPPQSSLSYLNIPQIISAAELTDADAIHPGYGFLAENAEFADICKENNLLFIGPPSAVIRKMGDKASAKATMRQAGVPVIPGSEGVVKSVKEIEKISEEMGYPVILKASAGGGGRGMRIIRGPSDIATAYSTASQEALTAFGNGDMYLEKFIVKPRHIEVQILADTHGNVMALGERECSIQRRHQKLIEESPSPAVTPEIRKRLQDVAVKGAAEAGYVGAGTIEFLLDAGGDFYFMEMNTRIQVEHPVTEMVIGMDLVKKQIQIADGFELPKEMAGYKLRGHAIEVRVNAEDPDNNFRPNAATISTFHMPGGSGVRVDSHAYGGYQIPPYYDSMIAKVIVQGHDRESAINRMQRALEETVIEGLRTTIPFQQQILAHPDFIKGDFDTGFLERFDYKKQNDSNS